LRFGSNQKNWWSGNAAQKIGCLN